MPTKKKYVLACALLAAACLPLLSAAAVAAPGESSFDARVDSRLTGFARPRMLEYVPGSTSVNVRTYFFRPMVMSADMLPALSRVQQGGVVADLLERNRAWGSGQYSFMRPERGHRHGHGIEDDIDDDLGEHGHGHGHGHDDGHGGSPVPLPAPLTLLLSGLAAVMTARRLLVAAV
jgi:hypothetical protein